MTAGVGAFGGQPAEWDAFVRSQAGWTHFHLHGWRDVISRAFGHECIYLAARDETGALCGVLPLVRVRSPLFGHYLVSMPFVNYGGPLGTAAAVRSLAAAAVKLADDGGVKLLELRSRVELPLEMTASHRKITVVLDLPPEAERLWKALPAKVRSQVRRPQKEGVEVRFGPDQVGPFFKVFAHHMRDLGTPTHSRALFEAVRDVFGADAWFGCAYVGERPVACGAGFVWEGEFEMTWASALSEYNRIAPNMLLYWSFMERAIEHGLGLFNFGRCSPGVGTHRFKRQWGSRDEQLWWYQHAPGGTVERATPSPDSGTWAWGPRVWRKLPVTLANVLGPRVVKYIP